MNDPPIQLLLVDDNTVDAALLAKELADSPFGPFSITHARRLEEASGRLHEQSFDAVVLDLGLPDSQGLTTLAKLQNITSREVAVVIVTRLDDEALRIRAMKDGADDYLVKGTFSDSVGARSIRYAIERKRANEAFLESELRLRLAVDAARIGIFDWNVRTGKINWSHHHASLFGLKPGQFGGTIGDYQKCVHPDDNAVTIARIEQSFLEGKEYRHEFRVVWPDGSEHWIAGHGRVFNDHKGRPVRMLGTVIDISERKASAETARTRDADRAHLSRVITVGQMASGLAHELGQPLGAISNYATACRGLMQSQVGLAAGALEAIEGVLSESRRAATIIDSLRSFIRKREPSLVSLDINALVRESVGMMQFEWGSRGIRPRLQLAGDLPNVSGDAVQTEQVLVNLIKNALESIGESAGNALTVHTVLHDGGHSVEVSVIDTGTCVSPEKMSRLFEPFFTTKPEGLGLGLNICRSIVEGQGGRISACANPDRGMRFSFTLPVAN